MKFVRGKPLRRRKKVNMGYYEDKQTEHEEMADYLFWLVVICAAAACIWAGVEMVKFLMKI